MYSISFNDKRYESSTFHSQLKSSTLACFKISRPQWNAEMLNWNSGQGADTFASCVWQINQDSKPGHKILLIGNKLYYVYAISEFN